MQVEKIDIFNKCASFVATTAAVGVFFGLSGVGIAISHHATNLMSLSEPVTLLSFCIGVGVFNLSAMLAAEKVQAGIEARLISKAHSSCKV